MANGFGSLYVGSSGLKSSQNALNTTANNLANVNTTGYKTEVNEFKSLLYQNIQTKTTCAPMGFCSPLADVVLVCIF